MKYIEVGQLWNWTLAPLKVRIINVYSDCFLSLVIESSPNINEIVGGERSVGKLITALVPFDNAYDWKIKHGWVLSGDSSEDFSFEKEKMKELN